MSAGFALPRDAGRRPALPGLRRRSALWGARRNCIFTARGGVALTGAGRSVIGAGFALPRDADRRSAFPGLRAALPGGGSAQLHFHSKRWCGTHGGRAQRHRRGFRAPARADRRSAFPGLRRRSARWGLGATAFSQQEVVWHSRGQGAASLALVSRSRACRPEVGVPWPARRSARWGTAQLHLHSKRWCGTHGGRAQRHRRWFRAPARCRSGDRRSSAHR